MGAKIYLFVVYLTKIPLLFSHFSTEFSEVKLLGGVARERCCNIESIWNFRCDTGNEIMVKTKHDFWSLLDHDVVVICHMHLTVLIIEVPKKL